MSARWKVGALAIGVVVGYSSAVWLPLPPVLIVVVAFVVAFAVSMVVWTVVKRRDDPGE